MELVSCRFRRQRYALEPACWVPLPYFSAMVFCCLGQHVFGGRSVLQFPCGEGCVLEACSTSSSSTTSSNRSSSSRPKGPAAELVWFYQNPEGTSSLGAACFWRSFRPSVAWCFGVAKGAFWRLAAPPPAAPPPAAAAGPAAAIALFLTESRRIQKGRQA